MINEPGTILVTIIDRKQNHKEESLIFFVLSEVSWVEWSTSAKLCFWYTMLSFLIILPFENEDTLNVFASFMIDSFLMKTISILSWYKSMEYV